MNLFNLSSAVADMRAIALGALPRMYRPDAGLFAFRLRRRGDRDVLEGVSRRYTAIVLIALASESEEAAREVLGGERPMVVCGRLATEVLQAAEPGEVALALWAARELGHPCAGEVLERLRAVQPGRAAIPTVELAWSLNALVCPPGDVADEALAEAIADRLKASFCPRTGLFPHYPAGSAVSRLRSHVCCYADLVYPIQALSWFHRATGDGPALGIARRCAERMCGLQGRSGQWWWHYDVRTGRVLERFPVYAVHQDGMGPMALFAVRDAGGDDHAEAIERSVRWLYEPPELEQSLIDREAGVIWRKVARREPGKLSRRLQAAVSSAHPVLRAPGVDVLFPPRSVDYETRPYHMGWILHAWPATRRPAASPLGAGGPAARPGWPGGEA